MDDQQARGAEFISPKGVQRVKIDPHVRTAIHNQLDKASKTLERAAEVPRERRQKYLHDAERRIAKVKEDINATGERWLLHRISELEARLLELT